MLPVVVCRNDHKAETLRAVVAAVQGFSRRRPVPFLPCHPPTFHLNRSTDHERLE